jgi:hypothetical protein
MTPLRKKRRMAAYLRNAFVGAALTFIAIFQSSQNEKIGKIAVEQTALTAEVVRLRNATPPSKTLKLSLKEVISHLKHIAELLCSGTPDEATLTTRLDGYLQALDTVSETPRLTLEPPFRVRVALLRAEAGISEFSAAALNIRTEEQRRALAPFIRRLGDSFHAAVDEAETDDRASPDYATIAEGIDEVVKTMKSVCLHGSN